MGVLTPDELADLPKSKELIEQIQHVRSWLIDMEIPTARDYGNIAREAKYGILVKACDIALGKLGG